MELRVADVPKHASKFVSSDLSPGLVQVVIKVKLADLMGFFVVSAIDNSAAPHVMVSLDKV